MKLPRFLKRLKCCAFGERKRNSRKYLERELSDMEEIAHYFEQEIETAWKQVRKLKRKDARRRENLFEAHEREGKALNTRQYLMNEVYHIERELNQELEARQTMLAQIIECGLRKMALEEKLAAIEKMGNCFYFHLYYNDPDPKRTFKIWRENLRIIRSSNDLDKSYPQPPLVPAPVEEHSLAFEAFSIDDIALAKQTAPTKSRNRLTLH